MAEGATAGALGAILPEPDASFRSVEAAAGRRVARAAWEEAQRGARDFAAALRKLPTKCDLTATSLVINARTADDAVALRKEQAARREASIVAPWLTPTAVRDRARHRLGRRASPRRGLDLRSGAGRARAGRRRRSQGRPPVRAVAGPPHEVHAQVRRRRPGQRDDPDAADFRRDRRARHALRPVAPSRPARDRLRRRHRAALGGDAASGRPAGHRPDGNRRRATVAPLVAGRSHSVRRRPVGVPARPAARQICHPADRAADVRAVASIPGNLRSARPTGAGSSRS